jgi:hypothetical protein
MTDDRLLDRISIASPCTADWNAMQGDDRTRFCDQCSLHVHDLSAMTADEAMDLLYAAGKGRLCVRFHRRQDGRVLTQDCPVGLRQKLRRAWARTAALVLAMWGGMSACWRQQPEAGKPAAPPIERLQGEVCAPSMGDVAVPQPVTQPPPEALMGKVRAPDQPEPKR